MKSRRRIASPKARDKAPYQVDLAMSALGQKRTCAVQLGHVRFVPIADIGAHRSLRRFTSLGHAEASDCSLDLSIREVLQWTHAKMQTLALDRCQRLPFGCAVCSLAQKRRMTP